MAAERSPIVAVVDGTGQDGADRSAPSRPCRPAARCCRTGSPVLEPGLLVDVRDAVVVGVAPPRSRTDAPVDPVAGAQHDRGEQAPRAASRPARATLTCSSRSLPAPNASSPISSDTVNPMPASIAIPITSTQASSSSSSARVNVASSQVAAGDADRSCRRPGRGRCRARPGRSASRSSPSMPPIVTPGGEEREDRHGDPRRHRPDQVLEVLGQPAVDAEAGRRTGTVKASSTPATVAWTPDAWTSAQAANASGSSSHTGGRRRCTSRSRTARSAPARQRTAPGPGRWCRRSR